MSRRRNSVLRHSVIDLLVAIIIEHPVTASSLRCRLLSKNDFGVIALAAARKIRDLVKDGTILIGSKPTGSLSLAGHPAGDDEIKQIVSEVWGDCDGSEVTRHDYGNGRVYYGKPLAEILQELGCAPDFICAKPAVKPNWTHRVIGDADIYLVANARPCTEQVSCTFRITGKAPELWHPDTGGRSFGNRCRTSARARTTDYIRDFSHRWNIIQHGLCSGLVQRRLR